MNRPRSLSTSTDRAKRTASAFRRRLLDSRLTLAQHREVLVLAGWLALLVGCVEYDMRDVRSAEATRQAAASLGGEAGHAGIMAWAQEMTCWFALTQGRFRQVIEAARAGHDMAPNEAVAVQLAGQEAKAWARMGDRREVELALDRGRRLLESLPYPSNIDNHFTFDPDKYDFYAMDCYRRTGEDAMARMHAHEVLRKSTAPDGSLRSPMRASEAHTTLAVVSAREGTSMALSRPAARRSTSLASRCPRCSWSPATSSPSYELATTTNPPPSTTSSASTRSARPSSSPPRSERAFWRGSRTRRQRGSAVTGPTRHPQRRGPDPRSAGRVYLDMPGTKDPRTRSHAMRRTPRRRLRRISWTAAGLPRRRRMTADSQAHSRARTADLARAGPI